ncbi:MAG TPA: bifunctional (p)ppGpp synthetase/guanosine-3',5'-bis(diphosphate) 3'-pyrophosphohydrolase [Syntrophorhabdaceae bacterium]|nr:bifunctional (p)ppGpp synthetase/guanosine-3',5'-bis(diphosphate) 3'-pyrophosphohydrolase [Syntrophorhabdaceae bacterium]MDI9562005.1 bifunctional (p)ppGpp synthetase/guanosine-3',5'-bis(diphosphate) 3'-pyrophosphohydrolase [Pseudomonadota bacterium]HQG50376.1 bifunctional (p)ppGpp synthetase/guanosine-3',5'-bis(diphosphate) 3'-pyrophosphohydrolase [Syntrophorhabdaceae bacterium]HQI57133.1 bifunctional (p)ppGpp synthetase/guanosine-3',5'-bis(diphosphate) 3'-pyrophosphohydrolase [Syntrophorhab
MVRFNDIVDEILKYNPQEDLSMLEKAYVFSAQAHKGQTRLSGEPYLVHPLEVAYTLTKMNLDISSVVSGLLHDTIEDSYVSKSEIEENFGTEVAELVDGVTKIGQIPLKTSEDSKVETFRKMLLAMSKDIRVILIKLADRYHNMKTLNFLNSNRQIDIARETMDIYAPLAHRLGIEWLKGELEDEAFKYLLPLEYKNVVSKITKKRKERDTYIEEVIELLKGKFQQFKLDAEIFGRAKKLYSIYRKTILEKLELDDIYDLTAFRVIVNNVKDCYLALGLIHSFFKPIPGKFNDYIALPKPNMYQSLHTKVVGPYGEKIEIQIRTHEMHKIAEEGIAAHWKYKEGSVFDPKEDKIFGWLRRLIESQQELKDNKEFMEIFKIDLFPDEIYVFTPRGDVKELSKGSTPVDFAYAIHSQLGHTCVGAKVNGRLVPLKYELKSGDTVDIQTNQAHKPSKDWLNFVKTSRAKTKIRQWIKAEQRERSIELGKSLIDKELSKYDLSLTKMLKTGELLGLAKEFSFETVDDLFAGVGYGLYSPMQVLGKIIPEVEKPGKLQQIISNIKNGKDNAIRVQGVDGMVVRFAKCCNPIPGDIIFGFITRGRGLTIHAADCPNIHTYDEQRKIDVTWEPNKNYTYPVKLKIIGDDRKGLLSDISSTMASNKVNIVGAHAMTNQDKTASGIYEVEVGNMSKLQKVIKSIQKIKGVKSVERIRGTV